MAGDVFDTMTADQLREYIRIKEQCGAPPAGDACKHDGEKGIGYDLITCRKCGFVCTDLNRSWGVARGMWFDSRQSAEFFGNHGRVPDGSPRPTKR